MILYSSKYTEEVAYIRAAIGAYCRVNEILERSRFFSKDMRHSCIQRKLRTMTIVVTMFNGVSVSSGSMSEENSPSGVPTSGVPELRR